jgi:DNA replication and repair protein RecF
VHLRSLQLINYRNFRRLSLTLGDGPTVIVGENAQGKSNLVEAIELLATTKSVRAGTDRELVNWAVAQPSPDGLPIAEPFARISAVVARERAELHADVLLRLSEATDEGGNPTVSKVFRLNGLPRRALEFVGEINVVSFSPEDVTLVAGPPSGRRRYLDITNTQMSARYVRTLQRYGKVVEQRNSLLRTLRESGQTGPSLVVWNQELATNAAFLVQERARSVHELGERADRWFKELGGWGQRLEIRYRPALGGLEGQLEIPPAEFDGSLGRIHSLLLEALARVEPRERAAGVSLVGPHRDDLSFVVEGVDLNVYGSRGQQRLAALALKLGEVDVLQQRVGSRPILLLDDVLSELDERKQRAVVRVASAAGQTILTMTSPELLERNPLPDANVFQLEAGVISPVERPLASVARGE